MSTNALEDGRVDAVLLGKSIEMAAQVRPLRQPSPDAEVGVIALREDPAVASRNDAELDPRCPVVRLASQGAPRDVPLERDPADDALAEAGGLRDDAVGTVGPDGERRPDGSSTDVRRDPVLGDLDPVDGGAVAELDACRCSMLGEVEVESSPLGHVDEAAVVTSPELRPE